MKKIFFIGFMGTGKTTIGKLVSDKLNLDFIDTDSLIEERLNMSISNIFEEWGEEYFRKLEHDVICKIIKSTEGTVIATGGGTPLYHGNLQLMKNNGLVIGLNTSPKELWRRLQDCQERPLLKQYNTYKKFCKLYRNRSNIYAQAHITIKTDGKSLEEIVKEVISYVFKFF